MSLLLVDKMVTVIALASLKGGVGKTTISENLAIVLATAGRRVLLVDADIATAGLSTILGMADRQPNLHDLLSGKGDPSKALYDAYGLKVLPSGGSVGGFVRSDPVKLGKVIAGYKESFDVVVIDTPPGLSKYNLAPLKIADMVVSVTTQDPSAVEAASKLEEISQCMGFKIVGVAVNRVRKSGKFKKFKLLNSAQIQARLRSKLLVGIPEDVSVAEAATFRRPAIVYKPKGEVTKSIRALVTRLGV